MSQATALRLSRGSQFFDNNGRPLSLGTLTYQIAGGSALQPTFSDSLGNTPNANPITLDGSGRIPVDIYLGSTGLSNYKETLRDGSGATVFPWPADNIPKGTGNAGINSDLSLILRANDADLNIVTGSGVNLPGATTSLAGLMSAADKVKVNNLNGLSVAQASQVTIKNNTATPNTAIDVATGPTIMTDGNGAGSFTSAFSGTINLTTSGGATGGGLDTGTIAPNTWYHVYQITNGTVTAVLASISPTNPTLPAGFAKFIRLGAMQTDGSSALFRTSTEGC